MRPTKPPPITPAEPLKGPIYCPGCGNESEPKRDKWQRPCLICFLCGMTIFCRTKGAEAGFFMMQKVIARNPKGWRATVQKLATVEYRKKVLESQRLYAEARREHTVPR